MSTLKEKRAKKKAEKQLKHANPAELFIQGGFFYKNGEFEKAIVLFSQAISLNPKFPEAYNNRSNCFLARKKYDLALKDYNKAIELNPKFAKFYYNLAKCYKEKKIYDLAIFNYNKVIILSNDNEDIADSYSACGDCYLKNNQYNDALKNYDEAILVRPKFEGYYLNRGNYYLAIANYQLALIDYNKFIELKPNFYVGYQNRAVCHQAQKNYNLALNDYKYAIELAEPTELKKNIALVASNVCSAIEKFNTAREFVELAFNHAKSEEQQHKQIYLDNIDKTEQLKLKNEQLELEIKEKEKAYKIAHEKEKEMLSFFTHTMRNALATAPESLRQAIRLLGSEDYEKNQKHYEAINEITSLFSTLTLTDCLIDTFKQSIYDTEEFTRAWQNDNDGEATVQWIIAAALRQALNRIIFTSDTINLRKLIQQQVQLIKPTRKAFIDKVLPLDINNQHDVELLYDWLNTLSVIEIFTEMDTIKFGANQIKFSLLFAITSELILNALKYWSGNEKIKINWCLQQDNYVFTVTNHCLKNASSNLAGTHKGLAFIKRLMELLGEKAQFTVIAEDNRFIAELKLHKNLLESNHEHTLD